MNLCVGFLDAYREKQQAQMTPHQVGQEVPTDQMVGHQPPALLAHSQ
jgi:hypothetical protein